jgi:GxxExxY protein
VICWKIWTTSNQENLTPRRKERKEKTVKNFASWQEAENMTENEIAKQIVDAAYKIHIKVGPGLLESAYQTMLIYELKKRGLHVLYEQPVPIVYEEVQLDIGYQADLIVEDKVIIELKSVEKVAPVHYKQLLTYLNWPINGWGC